MTEQSHVSARHKVLVVDDEPAARQKLILFLQDYDDFEVVAEAKNGVDALACIDQYQPSLIFLDIQMPKLDGISVACNLEFNPEIAIVFVTGFNEYAIKAFELNAVDYLLKPYDKARLSKTVSRYLASFGNTDPVNIPQLTSDYRAKQQYPQTLLFKAEGGIEVVRAEEIQWVESSGNYIKICLARTAFIARQTLNGVKSQLDPTRFIRIHRSHIININEVIRVESISKGDHTLRLKSGTELKLSRAYSHHFFALFKDPSI